MNRLEVDVLWQKAMYEAIKEGCGFTRYKFAEMVAAHEREKQEAVIDWAKEQQHWDKVSGAVAWHLIDRHAEDWAETSAMMDAWLRVNVEVAVLAEREACAKVCDTEDVHRGNWYAAAIRARGEK